MSVISGTLGAVMGSNAQEDAANTAAASQRSAQAQQQANFNLVQEQEKPYREFGTANLGDLQKMLSGGYDMKASPSAQYALSQGTKAINSQLGARGLEGHAVQQLGQMSSSTAANDYSNRFQQLLSAVNIGTNATAMTGSGVNSLNSNLQSGASNLGQIFTNSGNAQANIIGGAAGNMGGVGAKLLGNYLSNSGGSSSGYGVVSDSDIAGGYRNLEYLGEA